MALEHSLLTILICDLYTQSFTHLATGKTGLTLRIRLKSSLSTLRKWQLSSRKTMEAALGASFTRANLPKSSPSCRVQTTPWRKRGISMKAIPETQQMPTRLTRQAPAPETLYTSTGLYPGVPKWWECVCVSHNQIIMFPFCSIEYYGRGPDVNVSMMLYQERRPRKFNTPLSIIT